MTPRDYAQLLYETLENKTAEQHGEILERFKKILVRDKEVYLAPIIEKEFAKIQLEKDREKITYIASASKLTASQEKELENMSAAPREFSVNQGLLGGVAVRQKDLVYNATFRKKIETLKWQL